MLFMGKPIEYWVELQAMVDAMAIPDVIERNIKLERVALAAKAFMDASKYMENHTVWEKLHEALKDTEHLLEKN